MKILHVGLCVSPPPLNGLQKAFIANCDDYREISSGDAFVNQKIFHHADTFTPDLVFMQIQQAGIISTAAIRALRSCGSWIANWNGDVRDTCPPWMVEQGNDFNISLFSNMRDVKEMRGFGKKAEWLEIGYDPEIYKPEGPVITTYPIVYFGNNVHGFPLSEFRTKMCNALKRKYYGKFGSYGMHPGSDGNFNSSQPMECAAYRSAKIAINVSHYEIEKYTSDRMFRILGTGRPICLAKWYPGIEDSFTDHEHLRIWRTIEELEQLIDYYMAPENEEERARIAHNGMLHAQNNFTFDVMVKNLIKIYERDTK